MAAKFQKSISTGKKNLHRLNLLKLYVHNLIITLVSNKFTLTMSMCQQQIPC